ncbi:glycosyltransferase family 39 protein [Hymenobacter sp. 5516J-16]|uniref:glycosyltransferase family 39 protein n=1 Tax=Hymenobacter sp. 5516J-16 TaxID=2932253 RepID=UPI001FD439A7|nr:glycosyltransferase family 39 protein [Hymenobacter sp. 5516J-16]UOQ78562.1 glycosyltransferase family 39 protein [Hymenobacter sp. 5516J-16]
MRNVAAGLFAGLVLLTTAGYFRVHVAWSGDYDGLLVCWQLLLLIFYFQYLEKARSRDWWLFTGALLGAMLTKGVAGLLGLPGLLLYTLWQGRLGFILRNRQFYAAVAVLLGLVGGYYLGHEVSTPGYWQAVRENELGGRFSTALNDLSGPWNYYLVYLKIRDFVPWLYWLAPAVVLAWWQSNPVQRRAVGLLLIFSACWLLLISCAATKLAWYAAPIYPPLALLTGLGIARIWELLHAAYLGRYVPQVVSMAGFTLLFFGLPYRGMLLDMLIQLQHRTPYYFYRNYLSALPASTHLASVAVVVPDIVKTNVVSTAWDPGREYNPVFTFYKLAYKAERNLDLRITSVRQLASLVPTDTVVVCDETLHQQVQARFVTRTLGRAAPCQLLVVLGPK